jgi:putative phosphoribosyl transferase
MSDDKQGNDRHEEGISIMLSQSFVEIPVKGSLIEGAVASSLQGDLCIPTDPKGIVLFSHGSGSGRQSPRNKCVAKALNEDGLATLLVDLLTQEEEQADIRAQKVQCKIPGLVLNKFNIKLLANRLSSITSWISQNATCRDLILGYFGASTGTAAALIAAAAGSTDNQRKTHEEETPQRTSTIGAIVSRSGRPDLAGVEYLNKIKIPTLFIVGGNDHNQVLSWNKNALDVLGSEKKKIVVVPNASHLFDEPGALEEVARLASGWFRCYFGIKQHAMENK